MKLKPKYTFCLVGKGRKIHIAMQHAIFTLPPWSLCNRGNTHNDTVAHNIDVGKVCATCMGIYLTSMGGEP